MTIRSVAMMSITVLGVVAACSHDDGERRRDEPSAAAPATTSASPAADPAETLSPGDVRIVTTNGGIDLALLGDSISSGLSREALRKVRVETDTSAVSGTDFGSQIEKMVKGTVQGAIGKRIAFPISELREVRYDGDRLVFDWAGQPRKLFDQTKIDGKPLLASFAPEDARRFAEAVNARIGKPTKPRNL